MSMNKITLKEMQSLLGLLNIAYKVVSPGRAFCRRLINATMGIKKPHHKLRMFGYHFSISTMGSLSFQGENGVQTWN